MGNNGSDVFTIDPTGTAFNWYGGVTYTDYIFNSSDAHFVKIDINSGNVAEIETSKETMRVNGDIYTELGTNNSAYEPHYKVSSAGYHYADGPGYDGILQRAHFARTMLSTTSAGTATLIGGIPLTSSSVKTATGTYEYTIDSDVVAPYDEAKKCIAGGFVVTGSVLGSSGASNAKIMNISYTGDHTFTVYTMDSAGTLSDSSHRLVIFW
jgi:hypothetical protein